MNKIASNAVFAALSSAGPTMRKLASEKQALELRVRELETENRQLKQAERVQKLASEIHEKNLDEGRELNETQAFLMEKAASGELDLYEQAVGIAATRDFIGKPGTKPTHGGDPLERVVFGEG
jgi:hypothetical protein